MTITKLRERRSGSFVDNMNLTVHRWFRYTTGFSGSWARDIIATRASKTDLRVFDPFAGSGTSLIAAEQCAVEASGIDSHPFISRVAKAKLSYRSSPEEYFQRASETLSKALLHTPSLGSYAPLIRRCYSDAALEQLDCLRDAVGAIEDDSESSRLVWLTLVAILRRTSYVGTANLQYIQPNRRKSNVRKPFEEFENMVNIIHGDMLLSRGMPGPRAKYEIDDARTCAAIPDESVDLVLTSPPYANNYDYADATRLELTFLGEIASWSDLQLHTRQHLVRSCTQHVPDRAVNLSEILQSRELDPIREEILPVCEQLGEIRLTKGGKKTYNNMVACYFLDLAHVWAALRRVCAPGAEVCFMVGDSAPYGVYVPTIDWLGKLAIASGFDSWTFTKTRDRNIKWKNRKHRVPLCEGELWVKG